MLQFSQKEIKEKIKLIDRLLLEKIILEMYKLDSKNKIKIQLLLFENDYTSNIEYELKNFIDTKLINITSDSKYLEYRSLKINIKKISDNLKTINNNLFAVNIYIYLYKTLKSKIYNYNQLTKFDKKCNSILVNLIKKINSIKPLLHEDIQYDIDREIEKIILS